jgi:hypothetical protein
MAVCMAAAYGSMEPLQYDSTMVLGHIQIHVYVITLSERREAAARAALDECLFWNQQVSTVPLCNIKFHNFSSLNLGQYCTFACGRLFMGIMQIELYCCKQTSTYKSMTNILSKVEKRSRALEVTLGSNADPNLGHFRYAFSQEVVCP